MKYHFDLLTVIQILGKMPAYFFISIAEAQIYKYHRVWYPFGSEPRRYGWRGLDAYINLLLILEIALIVSFGYLGI